MPRNHEIFAERKKQKEQEQEKEQELVVIEDAEEVPSYRELDENEAE